MKRTKKILALFAAILIPLMLLSSCVEKSVYFNNQKINPGEPQVIRPGESGEVTFEIRPKPEELGNGRYFFRDTLGEIPEGFRVELLNVKYSNGGIVKYSPGELQSGSLIYEGEITIDNGSSEESVKSADASDKYIRYTLRVSNDQHKLYYTGEKNIEDLFNQNYVITKTTEVGKIMYQPTLASAGNGEESAREVPEYQDGDGITINTGVPGKISPILENSGKVIDNGNGTYTATWGYYNRNAFDVKLSDCKVCKFTDAGSITDPVPFGFPELFTAGRQRNAFTTTFKGNSPLVWTIQGIDGSTSTATAGIPESQTEPEGIDLSITKTVEQDGKELDYTLTVKNNGDKNAELIRIDERVPSGTEFAYDKSWADKEKWREPLAIADAESSSYNRAYYCIASGIEPKETFTIHFIVNILEDFNKPGNQITNETSVSVLDAVDADPGNNDYTLVTTLGEEPPVTPPAEKVYAPTYPDLKISKTDNDKTAKPGENLEYSIKVENIGQNVATDVKIIETLPEGTNFVSDKNTGWKLENDKYVYDAGTLFVEQKLDAKFTVKVNNAYQGDNITNSVEVKCLEIDQNPDNNIAREETPVDSAKPDIEVTKQASSDNYVPGDDVEYVITVKNTGNADAKDVKVYESLPENMVPGENYSGWTQSDVKYVYEIGELKVGEAREIKFYAKVGSTVPEGFSTIDNTVKATDDGRDINLANNEYISRISVFKIEAADAESLGDLPETGRSGGNGMAAAGLLVLLTGVVLKVRRH